MVYKSPRTPRGDAFRARIQAIVDRPKGLVAWSLTGDVSGPMAWRKAVGDALQDWRLLSRHRRIMTAEAELFRSGLAEIITLRIEQQIASPILRPLRRVEWQAKMLTELRREPWAPSTHPVNLDVQVCGAGQ